MSKFLIKEIRLANPGIKEVVPVENQNVKQQPKQNIIEDSVYKIGNVVFQKVIDDYKRFEAKHNKDL